MLLASIDQLQLLDLLVSMAAGESESEYENSQISSMEIGSKLNGIARHTAPSLGYIPRAASRVVCHDCIDLNSPLLPMIR